MNGINKKENITWEQRYFLGRCSLFDALTQYMLEGVPVPAGLVEAFIRAQMCYQSHNGSIGGAGSGEPISDFAEPLGIALTQRQKRHMARREEIREVKRTVDWVREVTGKCLVNPSAYADTAFHEASKLLNKSASQVHDIYYKKDN